LKQQFDVTAKAGGPEETHSFYIIEL